MNKTDTIFLIDTTRLFCELLWDYPVHENACSMSSLFMKGFSCSAERKYLVPFMVSFHLRKREAVRVVRFACPRARLQGSVACLTYITTKFSFVCFIAFSPHILDIVCNAAVQR